MSGRVSKFLAFIFAVAIIIAATGSSQVVSHAMELTDYNLPVTEPAQPAYEESEGDSEDEILGDLKADSLGYAVDFFIIIEVGTGIPNEPESRPVSGEEGEVTDPEPTEEVTEPGTGSTEEIVDPVEPQEPEPAIGEGGVDEPAQPQQPVVDVSELDFNVYSKDLETVVIDGEEYVGGFVVDIHDKGGKLLAQHSYGALGQEIGSAYILRASATASEELTGAASDFDFSTNQNGGTAVSYKDQIFFINVNSAYIKKTDEFQVIPLLFNGHEVNAGDIRVSDEGGNVLASVSSVPKVHSKQKITVTAGTSVQNDRGQTLTNTEAIVTDGSLMKGHRIEATFIGSLTGPGECTNEISDIHIFDRNGRDATAYYDVELKKGRLVLVADGSGSTADNSNTGTVITETLVRDDSKASAGSSQQGSVKDSSDSASVGTSGSDKIRLSAGDNEAKSGKISATEGVSQTDQNNAGSNGSAQGAVLGARRADTGDTSMDPGVRLVIIVLCIMLISIISIKRNKMN